MSRWTRYDLGPEWPGWWDEFCESQNTYELPIYPRVSFEPPRRLVEEPRVVAVGTRAPRRVPVGHRQRRHLAPV